MAFLFYLEAPDLESYREGSARLALGTNPPFGKYVFVEKDPDKCRNLAALKNAFPDVADRISIHNREANEFLTEYCARPRDWQRRRAVLFLDPFGMQVDWTTIELIAATKAIDLPFPDRRSQSIAATRWLHAARIS
jgi:three-Cys-motif partner protein